MSMGVNRIFSAAVSRQMRAEFACKRFDFQSLPVYIAPAIIDQSPAQPMASSRSTNSPPVAMPW